MAIDSHTREEALYAFRSPEVRDVIINAIDANTAKVSATIAAITSTNLVGVDGTGSNAAPLAGTETRLDAIEAKLNALIAALKTAGLMNT